jgi:acyl-coenzyme A synthetase/AMP-(fatty) acid ligase
MQDRVALPQSIEIFSPALSAGVMVWRGARPMARAAAIANAVKFADSVSAQTEILNCCRDRYNFIVVLIACLLRAKPGILPGDPRAPALANLARQYERALIVTDHELDTPKSVTRHVDFDGCCAAIGPSIPAIPADQPAAIVFTSGSTGHPVGVSRTWQWLVQGTDDYLHGLEIGEADWSVVSTVPSQHSYGLETSAMLPLRAPWAVSASRPLFPGEIADTLSGLARPRALITTPYHLELLLRSDRQLPATDLVVSATAPLTPGLAIEAETRVSGRLLEIYGCSEIGLIGTRRPAMSESWIPASSLELQFSNGASSVSGHHLPGLIDLPDSITLTGDRQFKLGPRNSDIVKIAGHRASLAGLNAVLKCIPGVIDGAIIRVPDEMATGRQRLAGFVVLLERSLGDVRRELRLAVPEPFMPRPLRQLTELPRSAAGKVLYEHLLSLIERKASET